MPDEKKGINLQLSTAQFAQAKHRAHQMEMTLSQYIRHLIWCDTVRVVANVTEDDHVIVQMPNGVPIVSTVCPHPPEAQRVVTHQRPNDGPDEGETRLECTNCGAMLS